MLIQVIKDNTEQYIIDGLEAHAGKSNNRSVFQCRFSSVPFFAPNQDAVITRLKEHIGGRNGELLYCRDGDIFFQWEGAPGAIIKAIEDVMTSYCIARKCNDIPKNFFRYYDCHVHGEDLRIECRKKISIIKEDEESVLEVTPVIPAGFTAEFSLEQLQSLIKQLQHRKQRKAIEVLVVEDQAFSRTLMRNVISAQHRCHVAIDGQEAIFKYASYAPDIVFLDIELPDIDGHTLATLFNKMDSDAYIIMVTGNRSSKDVEMAKANEVKGFIIKPYNKQKILNYIDGFVKARQK